MYSINDDSNLKIINCSSVLGFISLPYEVYSATKFSIEALTDAMKKIIMKN